MHKQARLHFSREKLCLSYPPSFRVKMNFSPCQRNSHHFYELHYIDMLVRFKIENLAHCSTLLCTSHSAIPYRRCESLGGCSHVNVGAQDMYLHGFHFIHQGNNGRTQTKMTDEHLEMISSNFLTFQGPAFRFLRRGNV